MGNAIKLSEICDDYSGFKVHGFEGSEVLFVSYDMLTFLDTYGAPQNPQPLQNPFSLAELYQVPLFLNLTALPRWRGGALLPLTAYLKLAALYNLCAAPPLRTTHYALRIS